jgi:hypothetical protein
MTARSRREYKSGTRFCAWRWTYVPTDYIIRLHLVKTPWFALCLHWLNHPDPEPWLHDHPVTFLSLILRGGYSEIRYNGEYRRRWYNFIRANDAHTITHTDSNTLTFAFMGPKVRDWGYHTDKGWVYWKDYNREKYSNA